MVFAGFVSRAGGRVTRSARRRAGSDAARRLLYLSELLERRLLLTDVSGHVSQDTTWNNTSKAYRVTADLHVDYGATLTISAGVTVTSSDPANNIYVDGDLDAEGATFELVGAGGDQRTHIYVMPRGTLTVNGGTIQGPGHISVEGGAADFTDMTFNAASVSDMNLTYHLGSGVVARSILKEVTVYDTPTVAFIDDDFSSGMLYTLGSATATIDVSGNWWGATDAAGIGA